MSQQSLRREIIQKMSELATAGFGLVAALAWNDAIQTLFKELFGAQSAILAKFAYAILITAIVVVVTYKLGQVIDKIKKLSDINDNDESG